MKFISVITPCFNEQENIKNLYNEVKNNFLNRKGYCYEHIFIDNNSEDSTLDILKEIARKDNNIKVIVNARNFGHIRSPYYGLLQAKGDAAIIMASDLQDPPNYIMKIIKLLDSGFEIVMTRRVNRYDSLFKKLFAYIYYRYLKIVFQKNILLDSGDFWGVTGNVAHEILNYDYRQSIYFVGRTNFFSFLLFS
jgi:glycosyltransferase involved in cell wall biosynthesis